MIDTVRFSNFLAFRSGVLPLGPLTLLSGTNSAGKSTVLHGLALLRQSEVADSGERSLVLNGPLVQLGIGRDVLHSEHAALSADSNDVLIRISLESAEHTAQWTATYVADADVLEVLESPQATTSLGGLFLPGFQYLTADRVAPAVTYPKSYIAVHHERWLGTRGEHTANFLRVHGDQVIGNAETQHANATGRTLRETVAAWMDELSSGVRIAVEDVPNTDFVRLSFSRTGSSVRTEQQRATNVGFGLTYALPIIVACLSSGPGSLLLIENPEAHLHPKGQAMMGRLCALAAAGGAQVIVETHSDHVLNAVRLAVKHSLLSPSSVLVHFLSRREGQLEPVLDSPQVGSDGSLDRWPPGFFDEFDSALDALLR